VCGSSGKSILRGDLGVSDRWRSCARERRIERARFVVRWWVGGVARRITVGRLGEQAESGEGERGYDERGVESFAIDEQTEQR